MFAHIAEETTRLAHGFLGALFGLMLVLPQSQSFESVCILCAALYAAFVLNTGMLKSTYAVVVKEQPRAIGWVLFCLVFEMLILCVVFIFYFYQADQTVAQANVGPVKFGLIVYAAFVAFMNFSNLMEIFALPKKALSAKV